MGLAAYRIDLHPCVDGTGPRDRYAHPTQLPLGMLLPQRLDGLLAGSKNAGVTHIANGATRVHPAEWAIGEAAGALAAFAVERGVAPRAVHATAALRADFRARLLALGVPLAWPVELRTAVL